MINSGKESLCYIGDLAHHPILLLEKPYTEFAYDTDPKQSTKMLTMLAENRSTQARRPSCSDTLDRQVVEPNGVAAERRRGGTGPAA
jgi:hypothetical protein